MYYRFRFLYGAMIAGGLLWAGWNMMIATRYNDSHQLQKRLEEAEMTNKNLKRVVVTKRVPNKPARMLSGDLDQLIQLLNQHGLILANLKALFSEKAGVKYYRLQVTGNEQLLMMVMRKILTHDNPVYVTEYTFRLVRDNQIELTLVLALGKTRETSKKSQSLINRYENGISGLFCQSDHQGYYYPRSTSSSIVAGTSCSYRQIQVTGLITKSNRQMALVMFPNQQVTIVSVGDKLGTEKAWIKKIGSDGVLLALPDHTEYQIKPVPDKSF